MATDFKVELKVLTICFDDRSSNVIKSLYDQLFTPLFHICDTFLKFGCFPDKMKIAKTKPLFKADERN